MESLQNHSYIMHELMENKIWSNQNFQRSNMQNTRIVSCKFLNINFNRSYLTNLRIENTEFINCKFQNMDLFFCKFSNCIFTECDFSLSEISNNNFYQCDFSIINFTGARLANNYFILVHFIKTDLNGSTTKFNNFKEVIWEHGAFGNCTIDYNITQNCRFIDADMNVEVLGSVWGLEKSKMENIRFLSLGQRVEGEENSIYNNTKQYFIKKGLLLELFVFNVSFNHENIIENSENLLKNITTNYKNDMYLSPDELTYFFEILKTLRKQFMLPLLVMQEILSFVKKLLTLTKYDDMYSEQLLLFYNNLCLINNSLLNELNTYQFNIESNQICCVKIVFEERPKNRIDKIIKMIYEYVNGTPAETKICILKEEKGSYIVYILMSLGILAAFNIGTLLLTGGVKHLIKLRASFEVLFSKKLPKKYYLDVYEKDNSTNLSTKIIQLLVSGGLSTIPKELKNLSSDGINAQNIKEISDESDG